MPLRCRAVVAHLGDFEEGRGSRLGKAVIRLHLAGCRDCLLYLRQTRAVKAALPALAAEGVSAETKARLTERFRAWRESLRKGGS